MCPSHPPKHHPLVEELGFATLESEREPPRNGTVEKGKTEGQPVGKAEAGDTVRHLDDDQLSAASHFTGLRLPYTGCRCVHTRSKASYSSTRVHLVF